MKKLHRENSASGPLCKTAPRGFCIDQKNKNSLTGQQYKIPINFHVNSDLYTHKKSSVNIASIETIRNIKGKMALFPFTLNFFTIPIYHPLYEFQSTGHTSIYKKLSNSSNYFSIGPTHTVKVSSILNSSVYRNEWHLAKVTLFFMTFNAGPPNY